MISVMAIFGTRPEAIKLAPLILRLNDDIRFRPIVVVTGQHREMLDHVLHLFGISPDHDLNLQRRAQSLGQITTRVLTGLDPILSTERPDIVVVQGDTTTTFAGALAAFYHQIPVVHVEAGLRTFERYAPFPEEINRRLTSVLGSLHLAPTQTSVANLLAEGIAESDVICTGNTVIDALQWAVTRNSPYEDDALLDLDEDKRRVILVTAHRRESWGTPIAATGRAVARLAKDASLRVVVPLHLNPIVRDAFLPTVQGLDNVTITESVVRGFLAPVGTCRPYPD